VMKLAKEKNVTVLLDGQGADEILAGYHYYYDYFFRELFEKDVKMYHKEAKIYQERYPQGYFKDYTQLASTTQTPIGFTQKIKNIVKKTPFYSLYKGIKGSKMPDYQFFADDFYEAYKPSPVATHTPNKLSEILYHNTAVQGLQDLLRYADRNSMAHSREIRLPFLSHELVEFLFTLPNHFKIREGWTKYIQRVSFPDILPPEIAWRIDKIGYEPPQNSWLLHQGVQNKIQAGKDKLISEKIVNPRFGHFENYTWVVLMAEAYL